MLFCIGIMILMLDMKKFFISGNSSNPNLPKTVFKIENIKKSTI